MSPDFNFLEDTRDLSGPKQPFDWIPEDTQNPEPIEAVFASETSRDQVRNLMFSMIFYQLHRRQMYINYMAGGKRLFDLSVWDELRKECKLYMPHHKQYLDSRGITGPNPDWCPLYELQRLSMYTGIHWTWLHWAWVKCEQLIWKGGQQWQIARLERKSFL
ncbi:hypothetical protein D3C78_336140 [compost metagenome]